MTRRAVDAREVGARKANRVEPVDGAAAPDVDAPAVTPAAGAVTAVSVRLCCRTADAGRFALADGGAGCLAFSLGPAGAGVDSGQPHWLQNWGSSQPAANPPKEKAALHAEQVRTICGAAEFGRAAALAARRAILVGSADFGRGATTALRGEGGVGCRSEVGRMLGIERIPSEQILLKLYGMLYIYQVTFDIYTVVTGMCLFRYMTIYSQHPNNPGLQMNTNDSRK